MSKHGLNSDIAVLCGEITALAVLITNNSETDVFVKFSGHVKYFEVDIYLNGWKPNSSADTEDVINLKDKPNRVIKNLKTIKHYLIKLARGQKINFAYLPYTVEEVRHYSLTCDG